MHMPASQRFGAWQSGSSGLLFAALAKNGLNRWGFQKRDVSGVVVDMVPAPVAYREMRLAKQGMRGDCLGSVNQHATPVFDEGGAACPGVNVLPVRVWPA